MFSLKSICLSVSRISGKVVDNFVTTIMEVEELGQEADG